MFPLKIGRRTYYSQAEYEAHMKQKGIATLSAISDAINPPKKS